MARSFIVVYEVKKAQPQDYEAINAVVDKHGHVVGTMTSPMGPVARMVMDSTSSATQIRGAIMLEARQRRIQVRAWIVEVGQQVSI